MGTYSYPFIHLPMTDRHIYSKSDLPRCNAICIIHFLPGVKKVKNTNILTEHHGVLHAYPPAKYISVEDGTLHATAQSQQSSQTSEWAK